MWVPVKGGGGWSIPWSWYSGCELPQMGAGLRLVFCGKRENDQPEPFPTSHRKLGFE